MAPFLNNVGTDVACVGVRLAHSQHLPMLVFHSRHLTNMEDRIMT